LKIDSVQKYEFIKEYSINMCLLVHPKNIQFFFLNLENVSLIKKTYFI